MNTPPIPTERHEPRDMAYWANQASYFKVAKVPTGALNLNVEGHKAVGPLQGFGQLWQKTYQVRLKDAPVTPAEIIKTWKENFSQFWPKGNRFYAPLTGWRARRRSTAWECPVWWYSKLVCLSFTRTMSPLRL